ncbi:unnamed protein product [Ophioblennius macclurei]
MASSTAGRRGSMDEPPSLSESRIRLLTDAKSFIQEFDRVEPRLRALLGDMTAASEELEVLRGTTAALSAAGVAPGGVRVTFGVGLGLLVCVAPFVGALGLAAAAAVLGGAAVTVVNVGRLMKKYRIAHKVEQLGKNFMEAAGEMRARLEGIRTSCQLLEEDSAEVQAAETLKDLKELQEILQQISELRSCSGGLSGIGAAILDEVRDLARLLASTLRITVVRQDRTLGEAVVQSAEQSEKVTTDFCLMRDELQNIVDKEKQQE